VTGLEHNEELFLYRNDRGHCVSGIGDELIVQWYTDSR